MDKCRVHLRFLFNWNRISHPGDHPLLYSQVSILGKAVLDMAQLVHGALGAVVGDFRGLECQIGLSRPEDSRLPLQLHPPNFPPSSLPPSVAQEPHNELGCMHDPVWTTPHCHCGGKNGQGSGSGAKGVGWPDWMLTKCRHFLFTSEWKSLHYTGWPHFCWWQKSPWLISCMHVVMAMV